MQTLWSSFLPQYLRGGGKNNLNEIAGSSAEFLFNLFVEVWNTLGQTVKVPRGNRKHQVLIFYRDLPDCYINTNVHPLTFPKAIISKDFQWFKTNYLARTNKLYIINIPLPFSHITSALDATMDQRSLPMGYSFLGHEPDHLVCCDLPECDIRIQLNSPAEVTYKRLNCGHSFHITCLQPRDPANGPFIPTVLVAPSATLYSKNAYENFPLQ